MRTLIFSSLIACLILGTVSLCPKHCQVCNTDPKICDVCEPGYLWNSYKLSCELDYHAQDEWGGVCNTGQRQSPINLKATWINSLSFRVKVCSRSQLFRNHHHS